MRRPGRRSPRIAPTDGLVRPAHLFAAPSLPVFPLVRIRSPSAGLSPGRPPPNDHHREVAVLMRGTLHERLSQQRAILGCMSGCASRRGAERHLPTGRPAPECPGDRETQALGWPFATISVQGSPMTPTPALAAPSGRHVEIEFEPPPDPAPARGDRGPRLLLLHPTPAAQGAGRPPVAGLGHRGGGRGADRRRRRRHRPRDPRRPLHAA